MLQFHLTHRKRFWRHLFFCLLLVCAAFAMVSFEACAAQASLEEDITTTHSSKVDDKGVLIEIPTSVVNIASHAHEDLITDLRTSGEGHFVELKDEGILNKDYHVLMTLTEDDRTWWLNYTEELLQDAKSTFTSYGKSLGRDDFRFSFDEATYDHMELCYTQMADENDIVDFIYQTEFLCIMRQLLAGDGAGTWRMTITLRNAETGGIVKEASADENGIIGERLTYDDRDWERSYER